MQSDISTRFFTWAASRGLKNTDIAKYLQVTDPNSISAYRSRGLPKAHHVRAEALMSKAAPTVSDEAVQSLAESQNLVLYPSSDEFDAWTAAFKASDAKTFAQWAINGLNQLAGSIEEISSDISENILAFPEIPLIHAAAGSPVSSDEDRYTQARDLGPGRFACQLHGDSMATKYPDGEIVILRARAALSRPVLKKGEIYLFVIAGEKTLKIWDSREATADEIEQGITYISPKDGKTKVRILRPLNKAHAEIVVTSEAEWIGWLDRKDN